MGLRLRARHRLHEPETPVDRASDAEIVALLRACLSARDRLIVLLMARAGLRRGEVCGLRRSDVHLLADSRPLGCEVARAHLHVVRRDDNPNGAWAKSRRQRAVPLDFLVVQAFDTYALERMTIPRAAGSDFVLVNLFRGPVGAPVRPRTIGDLLAAASCRAGLATAVTPHQLRHSFGSSAVDAGCGIDLVADLLGHASVQTTERYLGCKQNLGHPVNDRFNLVTAAGASADQQQAESMQAMAAGDTIRRGECDHAQPANALSSRHLFEDARLALVTEREDHCASNLRSRIASGVGSNHPRSEADGSADQGARRAVGT